VNPSTEQQFRAALDTRDIIGQAKGILMVQAGVTADAAFQMLVRVSQLSNVPLRIMAQELVDSLPGGVDPSPSLAGEMTVAQRAKTPVEAPAPKSQ
jgi:hypothetical protein